MFFRFLVVGGFGFLIDAGLTYILIKLNVLPSLARIPAIATAMTFTWLANRSFTYKSASKRHTAEAIRYAVTASCMALLNYIFYFILVYYAVWPVAAVAIATICQTVLSFHAYRYFVFKKDNAREF